MIQNFVARVTMIGSSETVQGGQRWRSASAADGARADTGCDGGELRAWSRGCTFDDFLLTPQFSVLERRDPAGIDLSCRFSTHITLKRPIVSANMDTVTRAPMAIVQAEEGGLGIIDRGFRPGDIEPQVREVETVKRTQHVVIPDPWTIGPDDSLERCRWP